MKLKQKQSWMKITGNLMLLIIMPNSILNFRKVTKFGGDWFKHQKVKSKNKTNWGGGGGGKDSTVLVGLDQTCGIFVSGIQISLTFSWS